MREGCQKVGERICERGVGCHKVYRICVIG